MPRLTASSNSSSSAYSASGEVEHDGDARAPRLLVLAHHELAGLGRRLPVDVALRVAGAYSRIAWKERSESTRRLDGVPSRSRMSPALVRGIATVRGARTARARLGRARAAGGRAGRCGRTSSDRRHDAAALRRDHERLRDGCARAAAAARRIRRGPAPTGCRAPGSAMRCAVFAPRSRRVTPSPATTRSCSRRGRPRTSARRTGTARRRAAASATAPATTTPPSRRRSRRRAPPSRRAGEHAGGPDGARAQPTRRRPRRARSTRQTPRPPHDRAHDRRPPRRAE